MVVAVLGVAVLAGVSALHLRATGQAQAAPAELHDLALRALVIQQNVGSEQSGLDWTRGNVAQAAVSAREASAMPVPTAAQVAARRSEWTRVIDDAFAAGATRDRLTRALATVLQGAQNPDDRNLGGGVDDLTFTQSDVGTSTAHLEADATVWARFATKQVNGWVIGQPANRVHLVLDLARDTSGRWTITSMTSSFIGGTGP